MSAASASRDRTHLHNFHTASESDGGPWNWIRQPGQAARDHHYSMARAGFTDPTGIPAKWVDPVPAATCARA